jgi:hypothetical protein
MEFRGAIDFRIQPPWRWRQDDAEPASSAGLAGYQAMHGSDWPMIRHDRLFAELPMLALKPAVLDKYIRRNAEALLDRILK